MIPFAPLRRVGLLGLPALLMAAPALAAAPPPPPQPVAVVKLAKAPGVDGNLDEWGADGWTTVAIHPAVDNDDKNRTGSIEVKLKAGVADGKFHLAAKWPDPKADTKNKPMVWSKSKNKYERGKDRDDMFVVRFDLAGSYDFCMLSKQEYKVDLWQWSAGRSDLAGLAEDYVHVISQAAIENAAEYEVPGGGMVYIKKLRDAGNEVYQNSKAPAEFKGDELPGVELTGNHSGSLVDVAAKGVWKEGHWHLEMSRALNTGQADDRPFNPGDKLQGAIGVFNDGFAEHKSISYTLLFDFSAAK